MDDQITVNSSDIGRAREELFSIFGGLDAKRPDAWAQYGYKAELTFRDFLNAYERGGSGFGAVHRLLDASWQGFPRIKRPDADKPTAWEEAIAEMLTELNGWQKIMDLDRRNMVGRFAALVYRVGDGKLLSEPLATGGRLVDLVPVYEDQIRVLRWNEDQQSEQFGDPLMFQIRTRSPQVGSTDTQARPEAWLDIHPSRVQILAEGSVGDFFEGVPLLKAGFNALVDIEKVSGGGGESFLKNSARTIVFEYEPTATVQAITNNPDGTPGTQTVRQVHEEQTRKLNRNQDSSIVMQGGKATTLQTTIGDPTDTFHVAGNIFAASVRMPFTVLFGQQTGRLASNEDNKAMAARAESRRVNVLTPMLTEFVKRMQAAGLIEAGQFVIEWPPIAAPSDDDKLGLLVKATQAMKGAAEAGLTEPLFDANELRKLVGFEPRADDGMPTEADLKAEADAQAAAAAAKGKPAPAPAPAPKK